jgi:hypothetical protein
VNVHVREPTVIQVRLSTILALEDRELKAKCDARRSRLPVQRSHVEYHTERVFTCNPKRLRRSKLEIPGAQIPTPTRPR